VKRAIGPAVKLLVSVALIWLFLRQIDFADVEQAARTARPSFLFLAVVLFTISNLLGAVQWGYLLRVQEIDLPPRRILSLYFVGVFFNNFLVSNIGGDAVRVYDLNRTTGKGSEGFAATFLDRFVGLFVLILFSLIAFASNPDLWSPGLAIPMFALVGALVGILVFGFSRRLSGWILSVSEGIAPAGVVSLLRRLRESFLAYRNAYGVLARVLVIAAGVQLTRVGVYYAVGRGMNLDTGFDHFLIFIPLIAIVAAVPISFGGIGVRENLGAILFGRVGVPPAEALAMMFLGYLAGIVASLAGGVSFVFHRRAKTEETDGG
jgi:uncharacterized protein (TIRG00374 family)